MPFNRYNNSYIYQQLFEQDEVLRNSLRVLQSPFSTPEILNRGIGLDHTFRALEESRRIADLSLGYGTMRDLASGYGATRGLASTFDHIGAMERQVIDQMNRYRIPEMDALTRATREAREYADKFHIPEMDVFTQAAQEARDFMEKFRVPAMDEVSRLLRGIRSPIEQQYGLTGSALERSLTAMNQPWLDMQDSLTSITGIAKLHGIGHLVASEPPFAASVARTLRADFGDWRDPITWPRAIAHDMNVRAALYVERGFDCRLTDFPVVAFEEGLDSSGLQDDLPVLVTAYGEPVPRSDDDSVQVSFARNNLVHDWLQRFETHIRQFIDMAMTAAFGSEWPRHRMPNGMYEEWLNKKGKDATGLSWPLIFYADFTDYERIICKQDNWKAVFVGHFRRPELVRESLQRLYPSRLATMHARPLLQDDELYVFVEIKRLVRLFQN